jgi:hypothetical protein
VRTPACPRAWWEIWPSASVPTKELPQHDQPPLAGLGQPGQEGFDVVHVDQGPVVPAAVLGEEDSEVTQDGQSVAAI